MNTTAMLAMMLLSAVPPPAKPPGGIVLEQKTIHAVRSMVGMIEQDETTTKYFSPTGIRVETEGSKICAIFRIGAEGRVTRVEVDDRQRTFREENLDARRAADEAMRKRLEERGVPGAGLLLPGVPAAEAAGETEDAPEDEVTVRRIEQPRVIAGQKCSGVEILRGEEKLFEGWYTVKPAPEWLRRLDLIEAPGPRDAEVAAARQKEKGIELESTVHLTAGGRYEVRTTRFETKTVPAAKLAAPAGYRRLPSPADAAKDDGDKDAR